MREPWLREIELDADPAVAAVIFALRQAEEDLARFTEGLSDTRIWRPPPVGFHLKHIAGSLDRLTSYLEGHSLTGLQFAAVRGEHDPGATRVELLRGVSSAIARAGGVMRTVADFGGLRYVGRERIRVTAIGLMIHMAEHTQRHVGQVISLTQSG